MTTDRTTLWFNGVEMPPPVDGTVAALLREQRLPHQGIAVELNGVVVPRSRWDEQKLAAGDRIEVVQMVGGGA